MEYKLIQILLYALICVNLIHPLAIIPNLKEQLANVRKQKIATKMDGNYYIKKLLSKYPSSYLLDSRRRHHKHRNTEILRQLSGELKDDDFVKWIRQKGHPKKPSEPPQEAFVHALRSRDMRQNHNTSRVTNRVNLFQDEYNRGRPIDHSIIRDIETAYINNSLMYHNAIVERDAYLRVHSGSNDLYVTVIPNSVYYDIEKKCVNWLSSCSMRGLREELVYKITSP